MSTQLTKQRQGFPRKKMLVEELEQRILYSADAAVGLLDPNHLTPDAEVRVLESNIGDTSASIADNASTLDARHELVIVDTSVEDYQALVNDILENRDSSNAIEVLLLDSSRDGIEQISEILAQHNNLGALHLITHGSDGSLDIGNSQLNFMTLAQNQQAISAWGDAFTENGDLLIYGCNVAETQFGQNFVDYLSGLTGTDVAASVDTTGHSTFGGDWMLEYNSGSIESLSAISLDAQTQWSQVLAVTSNGTVTSAQSANVGTTSNQLTWSHTVNAGTNRALFVTVSIDGLGANVNSVTYGAQSLVKVGRATGNHAVEIWALVNPTVGTANVVVSFAGSTAAAAGAATYNGVNQSTPYGTFVGATGTGTTASVTVASAVGDLVIDSQYWQGTAGTGTPGAGQTVIWYQTQAAMIGGSSTEAGAASVVMSGTFTNSSQWEMGAVSIKAAAGITVTPTSGLTTTEAGGTATFSVVLDKAPTANVTIGLSTSDSTEGTLSTSSLTFTTANWNTPQTVTITGVNDTFVDGNIGYTIVTAAATSADTSYNGLNASDITVTNTDDDTYNTIYVDTTNDTLDGTTTSISALMANKGADGKISLREAITAANNTANGSGGADCIYFNISSALVGGVHTITLSYDGADAGITPDALPTITGAVIIDGTTEPDYAGTPVVVINGANAAASANGLYITSGNSTVRGLTIQNFGGNGIYLQTGGGNLIEGNYIGTNSAGTAAAANNFGVVLLDSANNTIGGTTAASRNVLSGNTFDGINISGAGSTGNVVLGNYIGTNAAGTAAVANVGLGIALASANNTVGGTTAGSGNVISGNGLSGVQITGTSATGNIVEGNYIGLNAAGTSAIANVETGVEIVSGASSNTIGGATSAARNVISGNTQYGVIVTAQLGATANNTVQGNYLGTNAAGTAAVSNGGFGVVVDYAAANTNIIGNLISGNTNTSWSVQRGGIYLYGSGGVIQGNTIGLDANGNALGNGGGTGSSAGIYEAGGSSNVLIGGTAAGQGNTIANNTGAGVLVNANPGNISILGNSIYSNTGLGIDLVGTSGVNANDAGDGDTGANTLQNFPVLSTAVINGSQITITGSLNSTASSYYRVEFFASTSQDATGYGEGQRYLGYANVSTNASGNATINTTLTATVAAGEFVSATATKSNSTYTTFTTTSEFSLNVTATLTNSAPVNTVPAAQTVTEDTALTISGITVNDVNSNLSTTQLTVSNGTLTVSLAGGATINAGANGSSTLRLAGTQTQINAALATLSYQGNANYNGSDTLTVLSTDAGGLTDTDTVAITITSVNDAPSGTDKAISTNEDTAYTFTASDFGFTDTNDSPANSLLGVKISTLPGAGSLTLNGVAVTTGQSISVANINSGLLVFTPAANANGTGYASFTFQVQDNGGTANGGIDLDPTANTITLNVTAVNDAPVASGSASLSATVEDATNPSGATVASLFSGNFTDAADSANPSQNQLSGIAVRGQSVNSSQGRWQYSIDGGAIWNNFGAISDTNAVALRSTDLMRFLPTADYNGTPNSISVRLIDNSTTFTAGSTINVSSNGGTTAYSSNTVSLVTIITSVNDAPSGTDKTLTTNEDSAYTFTTGDFGFTDVDGNTLTAVKVSTLPSAGSLTLNGVAVTTGQSVSAANINSGLLKFTPATNANGTGYASFSFQVQDNGGTANGGIDLDPTPNTITVNVTAVNDAPTFSIGDGKVSTTFASGWGFANEIIVQPDGKLLAVGYSSGNGFDEITVARYNADGTLDTSFGGGDGIALAGIESRGYSAVLQSDGKIVVTGYTMDPSYKAGAVRFNSNGTLDTTFGGDGISSWASFGSWEIKDVALQADGKLLMAFGGSNNFNLARINADGSLDTTFGGGLGYVSTDVTGSNDIPSSLIIQSDGKILMAGTAFNGSTFDFALVRYNADGSLDTSFGASGVRLTDFGGADFGNEVRLQSDGKIIVAGWSDAGGTNDFAIARYNTNGSLDTSFGNSGKTTVNLGGSDLAEGLTIQPDDKILITGTAGVNGNDFGIVRLNSNGTIDTSFGGGDGVVTTAFSGSSDDRAYSIVTLNDGSIMVSGTSQLSGQFTYALTRYNPNGSTFIQFNAINTLDGNPTYIENGAGVKLDTNVQIFDAELNAADNYAGAMLTLARHGGPNSDDAIAFDGLTVTVSGPNVYVSGVQVGTYTFTGGQMDITFGANATQARINTLMQNIGYWNWSENPPATVQIDWTFSDGNTGTQGSGGALQATGSTIVNITSANDAPSSADKTITTNEDTAYTFTASDFGFTDVDGNMLSAVIISTLPGAGTLTLNGVTVTASQTISVADINAGLLVFTPAANANGTGYASFTFQVQDSGGTANGGINTDPTPNTITVDVAAVNDAPSIILPANQGTLPNQSLIFSAATNNAIVINDVDAYSNTVSLTVSVTNGTLTLSQLTGLTFTNGDGNADASMTFEGTLANINAALNGLVYSPGGFKGSVSLSVTANDLGNTGAAGPLSTTDSLSINVDDSSFLQGNYLEVGFNSGGSIGTSAPAPSGFVNAGSNLGVIADSDRDGWASYDGDFILPGSPVDEWGINIGGSTLTNSTALGNSISGSLGATTDNGMTQSTYWNGAASGLSILNSYSVGKNDLYIDVTVTLTNTTGSALNDIYYYRSTDPDNNYYSNSDFFTTNTILSQGDDGSGVALVSGTQPDGSYMALMGFGSNARVAYGNFSGINPIDAYNGLNGHFTSGSAYDDVAISLVYKINSLAAGESVTLNMRYVFDDQHAPVIDLDANNSNTSGYGYQTTYSENAAPVLIVDTDAFLRDADSANLQSMTVTITNLKNGAQELLNANVSGTSITANYANGVLTLTGNDTVAHYEQVLKSITYSNTSENPDSTQRVITIVANDGVNNSNTATAKINISAVNDAPTTTPVTLTAIA
ncbi:MAG TPA: DUF4347 domain-containing protein, partial [Methylophilus sp.]|nr:DUF4347 domain-containing protein [Methylophilus sp.]